MKSITKRKISAVLITAYGIPVTGVSKLWNKISVPFAHSYWENRAYEFSLVTEKCEQCHGVGYIVTTRKFLPEEYCPEHIVEAREINDGVRYNR